MSLIKNRENKAKNLCALCGKLDVLSFEHLPPQCAFNNKPILAQGHNELVEEQNPMFGKYRRSQRGYGKYSLCKSCNNNTGNWYVKDFCQFVEQGMVSLKNNTSQWVCESNLLIKPQNVIKQILLMFTVADASGVIANLSGVREYLLERSSIRFPRGIRIYLYSNVSVSKRMIGHCIAYHPLHGICQWGEINFKPFGYFFTYDSPPPYCELMADVTGFSESTYDHERPVILRTTYLEVENMTIGHYSNVKFEE